MDHPDVKSEPEAMFSITKYNILKNLGSSYTFSSLDQEPYENIVLITLCMNYENKAIEMAQSKAQFVQGDFR